MQGPWKMGNKVTQFEERRRSMPYKKDVMMMPPEEVKRIESPHKPQMRDIPCADRPPFTEEQKIMVKKSWKSMQEDISKVGVVMFIGLFETHPDVQDLFLPFRNLTTDEMKHNAQLRTHALRVMGTVEKALARLDEPQKLEDMLHHLGRRHSTYNIKPEYIDLVGPQFVHAIRPAMEGHFTPEVEDAWLALFNFVAHVIKEAMIL